MNRRSALVTAVLLAAATPSWGQTAGPATGPVDAGAQGAALIPDFSGMWARLSFPGFELPLAGPGPLTNMRRAPNGGLTVSAWIGDYTNPILRPEAAEIVKRRGAIEASGVHAPSPRSYCWPGGVPFVFTNTGMQMFQQPDKVTFLYSDDHEVRFVRMNESHRVSPTPSWYGDSVAHYEGDTLVIDTVGIKIGPYAMVDVYGTPHTPALHVVERYRLIDYEAAKAAEERAAKENLSVPVGDTGLARDPDYQGKGLQLEFTVEDDGVFTTSWTATVTSEPLMSPLGDWPEDPENSL
jgi:hypothetical protein